MEYLRFRGEFDDVPRDEIARVFAEHYPPSLLAGSAASWSADVAAEAQARASR